MPRSTISRPLVPPVVGPATPGQAFCVGLANDEQHEKNKGTDTPGRKEICDLLFVEAKYGTFHCLALLFGSSLGHALGSGLGSGFRSRLCSGGFLHGRLLGGSQLASLARSQIGGNACAGRSA